MREDQVSNVNKKIGQRLKAWGIDHYGSLVDFARALGITPQTLNGYTSRRILPGNKMQTRLRQLGCDVESLMTGAPLVVTAQARGITPTLGWAKYEGRIVPTLSGKEKWEHKKVSKGAGIPYRRGDFFCLEVSTDSLLTAEPAPIYPGDICVFEANRQPQIGDVVAVKLKDNKFMVKVIERVSQSKLRLSAANRYRSFPGIEVKKSEIESLGVLRSKVQLSVDEKRFFGIKR
jgi:transcriptional regulator with XRE-family HTH domain